MLALVVSCDSPESRARHEAEESRELASHATDSCAELLKADATLEALRASQGQTPQKSSSKAACDLAATLTHRADDAENRADAIQ